MKREQERSKDLRERSRELDRRRLDRSTRDPPHLISSRIEQAGSLQESSSSETRSTKDRAGTPKRVYPTTRSPEKKPESRVPRSESKSTPSEERIARMRLLGYDYYNGELMSLEEAQQLRKVMELSLQSSRKDDDSENPLGSSSNEGNPSESSLPPAPTHSPIYSDR
jgi:hypothetical protein